MIFQLFSIMVPMIFIVGVGYIYGARVRPEMAITNQLTMEVFMPALLFHVIIQDDFHISEYYSLIVGGTLVILLSGVLGCLVAKVTKVEWRLIVPPAMFSNWANLGLPLYVLALGAASLDGGIILVAVGNFICFTLGLFIYSGNLDWKKVAKTPILVALVVGLLFNLANITLPSYIDTPISMMGQVAIPLMLFSLGVRLTLTSFADYRLGLLMAAFCPIVGVSIALVMIQVIEMPELHAKILILFGALPPAVINFMLADKYHLTPERMASIVLIGNLVSIVTIPVVLYFLFM